MTKYEKQPLDNISYFARDDMRVRSEQQLGRKSSSRKTWGIPELCELFSRQISVLAGKIVQLETQLMAQHSRESGRSRSNTFPNDSICMTRRILAHLELVQHVNQFIVRLHEEPNWSRFELTSVIQEICNYLGTTGPEICFDTTEPFVVVADRQQLYVALTGLLLDLTEQSNEISISCVTKATDWELELTGFNDSQSRGAIGVRLAELVAKSHQGHLDYQRCPQGGYAVNFSIPKKFMRRCA
ncbi:MAG TPA: hypothetical protein PKD64_10640 [Pirellulaceae bacterium]|nr:hypothetical protein [Pirellulaceae bacterium]HMO92638.1 hypothetical protein [Pirellulaceae bacterium]HMP70214.1 hypothetical protein [Pirellulaceae bacterium]